MTGPGRKAKRLWRSLVGVVAAYAVAAQTLLVALGGFSPADIDQNTPVFELCHDASATPERPSSNPDYLVCAHCIFCFAGAHQAVIGGSNALLHRIDFEILAVASVAYESALPDTPSHSIASPRGPPLGA
jgi:hypothetical protein